jgi:hypothetical protein
MLAERLAELPVAMTTTGLPRPAPAVRQTDPMPPPDAAQPEAEVIDERPMSLDVALPQEVAVLWVQIHGDETYSLRGANPVVSLPFTQNRHLNKPALSLGQLAREGQGGVRPHHIYQKMRQWSRTKAPLSAWLNTLREAFGGDLHLVIADDTGFEIPWELFFINQEGSATGDVLGATVAITRWQTLDEGSDLLAEDPAVCRGGAIAYIASTLKTVEQERRRFPPPASYDSMQRLREALRSDNGEDCALVYLACQGWYSPDMVEFALGSERDDRVSLIDLYEPDALALLRTTNCIVFLNACNSARPALDPALNDDLPRGFYELFLNRGARGVVGTFGLVDDHAAEEVARRLIEGARAAPDGLCLSKALQELRAEEAARIHRDEDVEARFLYAFMYGYFGHPLTRLRLEGGQGAPE